ncbi:uncharacterized protein LOC105190448 [Harpegnathos saltator]|uniref:uncharacterized protein LOC105190448 n=1 Tax=Harpegnathos saltator TaxID=610380 RepID=UPI000DBED1D5|nr:uncharacterized protein LOC105190448 [Harpegnathos saltator]
MTYNKIQYFKLNRILLFTLGLWPYQQPKNARVKVILYLGILVRSLFEYMRHMCNKLKDKNEIAIIEGCGRIVKRYTIIFTLVSIFYIFILIVQSFWVQNFDVHLVMNESRSHSTVHFIRNYLDNRIKWLNLHLLYTILIICIELTITIATGGAFIFCFQYSCGMFDIASHRINQALSIKQKTQNDTNLENEIKIHIAIIYAVDIHRKAIDYATFLITSFEGTFFFMILFGVISLSLNLYRVYQIVLYGYEDKELLIHLGYLHAIVIYMFASNYIGQQITDHYNNIFITAYNIRWYMKSLPIQRLLVLLLQRGNKTFFLNIGGLFSASLECFATVNKYQTKSRRIYDSIF